jgi:hypothetical protein
LRYGGVKKKYLRKCLILARWSCVELNAVLVELGPEKRGSLFVVLAEPRSAFEAGVRGMDVEDSPKESAQ